ncbi:hypothetical protein Tco_1373795 [Tanacetum coccineum]
MFSHFLRCGAGDVVLRESYKPKTRGKLYYACPRSKKEERVRLLVTSPGASSTTSYSPGPSTPPSYSLGSSRNAECSNCKLLLGKIKWEYVVISQQAKKKKEIMSWLRRCAELREAAQPNDWVEILVLYCWRFVDEDFRVAGVINKLCEEMVAANE